MADVVQWAVTQGWVDGQACLPSPAPVTGVTGSVDGVGPEPRALFQCGIAWVAADVDINLMYSIHWRDTARRRARRDYGMPVLDRVKSVCRRQPSASRKRRAVEQAAKVRRPLLLAYGGVDARVP